MYVLKLIIKLYSDIHVKKEKLEINLLYHSKEYFGKNLNSTIILFIQHFFSKNNGDFFLNQKYLKPAFRANPSFVCLKNASQFYEVAWEFSALFLTK